MVGLHRVLFVSLLFLAQGCPADPPLETPDMDMTTPDLTPPGPFAERPYELRVPTGYSSAKPAPLLILLHGYTFDGAEQEKRFGLARLADEQGFLYAMPDGTKDEIGARFWNATDACCDQFGSGVDDVAYLRALITDVRSRYNVDPKRVYLAGHSNGGFMAYRMACDASELIAGVVSLAGATWNESMRCKPKEAVAVLQVHGDQDVIIKYGGGRFARNPADYPSARSTVAKWAQLDGCTGAITDTGMAIDLDASVAGQETKIERYGGCPQSAVELWTMGGSGHFPELGPSWGQQILRFLAAHPKK